MKLVVPTLLLVASPWTVSPGGSSSGLAATAEEEPASPPRLEAGGHAYVWDAEWPRLPEGMRLGNTHGCIVVDSAGNVYFNTDTEDAVVVIGPDGEYLRSFGAELKGGLHGMCLVREGERELLWLAHIGRSEVYKATLDGEILATIEHPEASGVYASKDQFRPTSVAVGPDGDVYVTDGYGLSFVHQYAADGTWIRTFGGFGVEDAKMRTPHGIWLDTREDPPVLLVADRENHRLQVFDLEGELLGLVDDDLRRPCHVHERAGELVVADLAGRVTLLGPDNEVLGHLGDSGDPARWARNDIPSSDWRPGEFISPHCARWDAEGNLYVMDWLAEGRVSRLERVR